LMQKYKILGSLLLLALVLSACGASTITPTNEAAAIEVVYTAAAATLSAQAVQATATPLTQPTSTLAPQVSLTPMPTIALPQSMPTPVVVVNTGSTCDNSAYVSDVTIPDGTVLAPGEAFTKTWKFQNTGTCTWTTSYSISYVSGNDMDGSSTALSSSLSSGGTLSVPVSMVAPTSTGTYTGYWKLKNAAGTFFGEAVYVQIVVSDDASTITPTTMATDEYTSTPTSTDEATSAPTNTPKPTSMSTSTKTPVPTSTSTTVSTSTPAPTNTTAPTNTPVPTETLVPTVIPTAVPTTVPTETPSA
jgi:hypothetical protein